MTKPRVLKANLRTFEDRQNGQTSPDGFRGLRAALDTTPLSALLSVASPERRLKTSFRDRIYYMKVLGEVGDMPQTFARQTT